MTIIVPKLPQASKDKPSEPNSRLGLSSTTISTKCAEDNNNSKAVVSHPVYKSSFKNISASLSLVISKKSANNDAGHMDCTQNSQSIPGFGSDVKVVTHGRRRSVDKQYRPSQPTGNNNGGGRTSSRRSGRSYQNYDNNSSNGNSGADGNGEDNDDSDDDGDDEYIDEDEDEEEEEEEEEEDDDDDKNDDEDDDDQQNNSVDNSIDEKVLATFGLKVRGESTVDLENAENVGNSPIPPGTPITLQGIVCHETIGGVLVVNIKWRNKIYCGSLMDCTRHSWARPRFQSTDGGNHPGKTRMGKSIGHGKGKGKGKRLRSNSVTSTNSNNHTVSPLKQKLRGRKKTISGSSVEKRQGFRSSKRKPKNDDDSDDSTRPGKRTCTVKGAPSPTPSPTLIPCPEPGCEKKYKHINGLRYHQAHAHLESKNQDEDNNSDDRSSTTPSPSEEFKEPDPLTAVKSRSSSITSRSLGESSTASSFSSLEKEPSNEDEKPIKKESDMSVDLKSDEKICESKKETEQHEDTAENPVEKSTDKEEEKEIQTTEQDNNIKEETKNDSEFVEVADKSTDTCTVTTASCTKHSFNLMTTVIPANEVPEVADTQEVWETVLDSGCVTTASDSETKKSSDVTQGKQDGSKGTKDEGQQVMITTCGINQLGIEVEDISENEEDIDPGQDIEFNSREEMEKAVENLQSGSFVASLSTENNLQMLSSLKDPSLIFGLSNRDRMIDEKEPGDDTEIEPVSESLETTTRKPENITESTKAVTAASNVLPCTISVETLVSRSITASKHEPPLTNADTPSSRFKYFPCRSYGDESLSVSNINNTNTTTLALIRDPELIKNDTNHIATTSVFNTNIDSSVESTKPSYTGSSGFNQDCTTSSIHSHGPKEELKEQSPVGDIIKSHTAVTSEHHSSGHSSSSYTSPKSSTTTTYNTKVYPSQLEMPNTNDTKSRRMNNLGNIEKENSNKQKDLGSSGEEKKTDETDKSSVMFSRQPSTLISKHNRPSIPSLPVGVAHPYQYSSMAAHSSGTTTSSHTVSQTDSNVPKCDEGESRVVSKEKPVGEVGPVSVKRPAIHAGLPTVIPVGAPGLKTQASLHVPIRQGLKSSGLEERASTPNSFRLASSPRSSTASPLPSSPRLSDSKSSKHSSNSPQSKPSNTDSDIVVVKQESDPTSSKVSRDTEREKKTSAYEIPKEHLTQAEQLQLYQYHQRQMLLAQQANIDPLARYAYLRSIGYEIPWQIPPEQHMKMMQQQRLRAAEEERIEFQAAKRSKEESSNVKYDKRESHSPMTSTPPRLERVMKDLSPGEGSRSSTSTSESASRGMPCLDQPPEKKTKLELPKNDETDRELQKLRHKRQEEYLSKQSMQHKFTMLKQLENAGGAAKTHSIPPISDTKDDYQKTKYSSTESSHQAVDKVRKTASDPEDSSQLELSSRSRDPSRDVHSKAKRMMSSERGSFIPSKYQEYLTHDQMLERYEHSQPGNSLLIPGHVDASYVSSRIRDRDSTSPYKSPSPRPSLTRSPSTSHRTSPYKIDRPSSSRSISPHRVPRPSFSDVHGYSSSSSRSSVFSRADKPKSPPHQTERHKAEVYSTNTSSSRSDDTPISRADSPKHGGYRDRLKEDAVRPGIISNNLAVRRGDVTSTMVIPGHGPPDEELLRRHSYMVYPQYRAMMERQQHMEQVYAMQNASRSEQYYGKRQ